MSKLFISLLPIGLENSKLFLRILTYCSIIRSTGGGLDLLESSKGYIIYLVHHLTVEDSLVPKQQR